MKSILEYPGALDPKTLPKRTTMAAMANYQEKNLVTVFPELPINDKTIDEILANCSKLPLHALVNKDATPLRVDILSADNKLVMHHHDVTHNQFPMGNWEWDYLLFINMTEIINKLQQRIKELENGNNG